MSPHPADADDADWSFIAYALTDAGNGIRDRYDAASPGSSKRAARHADLVKRLRKDLTALADIVRSEDFARSSRRADVALADAIAGPLAALGEDLRVAFRDVGREPPYDD